MNLKQLRYVLVLAHEGSFAGAAELLNISQPSLSQYVKKIEQQLGVQLFDRTGGVVRLTDAGRIYIDAGRKILDIEHHMCGQFNDLAENKTGSIVIGTSPYRSAVMMPLIARKFQEKYPGMHLVVEEMTTKELHEAAERGQFDLCLTLMPVNEQACRFEKIAEEELILAVPLSMAKFNAKTVKERKYPAIDAAEISNKPFVMITDKQWMQLVLNNLAEEYALSLKKAIVVKSLEAQIEMVRAGVGMALLPSGIERFCMPGEVVFYSLVQELPKREVVLVQRRDHLNTNVINELINIIKETQW